MLPALLGLDETPQYDTEGLGFLTLALGAAFIILLLIKHWRDQ